MTLRKAIAVLIDCAGRETRGAGCGLRALPSDEKKAELLEAVKRAFRYVNGHEPADYELRNLGMR